MGGSQSVAVNIALDKPVYVAGEVVRGYADVKVLKDGVVLPDLTVSLSGTTATAVRYTKTTGTGKNKKRVKKTARSNITFLMLQAKVGKIEASQLAAAAHLQVPFEFALPADAISSMQKLSFGGNSAAITYRVGVSATKPGMLFGTSTSWLARAEVDVVSAPPQSSTMPVRLEDSVKVTRCCCISAGTMSLGGSSSLSACQNGDAPVVSYDVDNQTSQVLEHVEVSVVRSIHFCILYEPDPSLTAHLLEPSAIFVVAEEGSS